MGDAQPPRPKRGHLIPISGGRGRRAPLPALSTVQTLVVLFVALGWFAFGVGPIWRHPWQPNRSIITSYLTIPPLVLVLLLASKRLSLVAWLFDSFRVAVFKFLITAFALVAMWATIPPSEQSPMTAPPPVPLGLAATSETTFIPESRPRRAATAVEDSARGRVRGRVVDADGRPVAGALAWIGAGLDAFDFDPPAEPLAVADDGSGFAPTVIAQVGRRLDARSADGRLHTLLGVDATGATVFSVPLIAAGTSRPLVFTEPYGLARVRCGVHAEAHTERESALLVLPHPFAATTDAAGAFEWRVPAATVVLEAARIDGTRSKSSTVEIVAGGVAEVVLTFSALDGG
ncbi:MAG: hypothetical protein NVS3B10_09140 [Polyangiales bacterium]